MSTSIEIWVAEQHAIRKAISDEFKASGEPIPDIDFTPPCPICDADLYTDDGDWFGCEVCRIQWPRNGYGSQAEAWL